MFLSQVAVAGHQFPADATVKYVDYDSPAMLAETVRGQDAVVSTLSVFGSNVQKALADASVTAGVKRFLPSEFGSSTENPKVQTIPIFGAKLQLQECLRRTMESSPEEGEVWSKGNGFRFMFSAFGDLATDEAANEEACNFIRGKIGQIMKDPAKGSILKDKELCARRPLCESGYYEIFNRDNVDVIDIHANPINQITKTGIELADGKLHDVDVLIFATGFDAIDVHCFPNMFLIAEARGRFANFPPVIESETNFTMSLIEDAEAPDSDWKASPNGIPNGKTNDTNETSRTRPATIEVSQEAEQDWADLCDSLVQGSVFLKSPS